MKQALLLLALVGLLTACTAPATPAAPASQPAAEGDLPEVTVYHSPT